MPELEIKEVCDLTLDALMLQHITTDESFVKHTYRPEHGGYPNKCIRVEHLHNHTYWRYRVTYSYPDGYVSSLLITHKGKSV